MNLLLLLRLGETPYAVEIAQVREIVEAPRLFYIPRVPSHFPGAVNIRGGVFPVLDLPGYLGFPGEGRDGRLVVLAPDVCNLALRVNSVGRIVPYDPQALLPPLERRSRDSFVRGMLERGGDTIALLDLPRLIAGLNTLE